MTNDAFVKNVASRLIEQIRNGTAPWQKPWEPGTSFLPFNPTNGTRYKGINLVNLLSCGYGDARWMTYRQAHIEGYQVRRGEKGTQVQYWRFDKEREIKDAAGRPVLDAHGETAYRQAPPGTPAGVYRVCVQRRTAQRDPKGFCSAGFEDCRPLRGHRVGSAHHPFLAARCALIRPAHDAETGTPRHWKDAASRKIRLAAIESGSCSSLD